MSVRVELLGLDNIVTAIRREPENARKALPVAVNFGAKRARQLSSTEMRKEIAFTQGYLNQGSPARLRVSKAATADNPTAIVEGRDRPTSLARFAAGRPTFGRKKGQKSAKVRVRVEPGSTVEVKDAFYVPLRRGNTGALGNVGIASKGRAGARSSGENPKYELTRKRKNGTVVRSGYFLRYGPSVDQVFNETRAKVAPRVLQAMEREFYRQLNLRR